MQRYAVSNTDRDNDKYHTEPTKYQSAAVELTDGDSK